MDSRQEKLLNLVIETHIETAEPVGSRFLVSDAGLSWGEATVRNELRALEEAGYLTHPHTSAGRVPTEKGYRYFVDHADFSKAKISKKDMAALQRSAKAEKDEEMAQKNVARALSEITEETVLVAFSPNKIYYTGISNLFSKPEIVELNLAADISAMFDRCEDCLEEFFDEVENEPACRQGRPKFFIGDEHPFGELLSVGVFRFGRESMFMLLGPQRMNYKKNWAILNKVKEEII